MMMVVFLPTASAQLIRQDKTDADWEVLLTPYLWAAGLKGTTGIGTLPTLELDASFGDIAEQLDGAFSLHTEFHRGKWAFVIDPIYISLEVDLETPLPQLTPKINVDMWLIEAWGAYKFTENFEVLAGARYQDQDLSVSTGLPSPPFPGTGLESKENWTDWFAGVRVKLPMGERWFFSGRADVAFAGDSESNYNVEVYINRRIRQTMALNIGYKYFRNDYDDGVDFFYDIKQQGPVIGYTWAF
jgi:hypothetical protein